MFHPKFTNLSPFTESTMSSSEPSYDINTTKKIFTRRSKKLHELREIFSKYTPRSVQLLEDRDDFSLAVNLQSKYQTSYNHALYGTWASSVPILDVGTKFSFCGNFYMIAKSNIDAANFGLFIFSHVLVPPKQSIAFIAF